jgi:hypothetical protein
MKLHNRILSVFVLLAMMSGSALVALAQDQSDENVQYPVQTADDRQYDPQYDAELPQSQVPQSQEPQVDPPSRAARLQYMSGSVSVQPHGTDEWIAGAQNRPLTNSDNIWADKNSRAEINVGTGLIRIDAESSLTLTNISENTIQLQLHQGAMNLHVRRLYDGETYEVDTANQAFTILKPGDYRFDVNPDADTTVVTVWRGEGESSGNGPSVRIRENIQARFTNGTSLQHDIHSAPSPDSFDQWSRLRDDRLDHSASSRYVSPGVVGSEDLDEYGTWRDTPSYGHVWVPSRVDVGWAPYRNGNWIWVDPWGWTWNEDEPWGYAPFHYGRWVYADNYWGWAPGPIYARPYYSPALVAWFGGGNWGASIGYGGGYGYGGGFGYGGGVGWCALGFGEPFIPWYGVSRNYFNNVNITNTRITNITNITNIYNNTYINNHPGQPGKPGKPGQPGKPPTGGGPYGPHSGEQIRYANMHAPNGFTAVSRNTLVGSQNVARNAIRVSPNQLSRVTPVHTVDARPTRTTVLGANARSAAAPPTRSFARPVVSRVAAPAGGRGSFNAASPVAANIARDSGRNAGLNAGLKGGRPASPQIGNAQMGNGRGVQRPAGNMPNRAATPGSVNSGNINRAPQDAARMPQGNTGRMQDRGPIASRSVPRPPSAGGFDNRGSMNQGGMRPGPANNPGMGSRPDTSRATMPQPGMSRPRMSQPTMRPDNSRPTPNMSSGNNVPRPSPGSMPRGMDRPSTNVPPSRGNAPASNSNMRPGSPRGEVSVPRPMGNSAPRGYSSAADRGSYSSPSPSPSYSGGGRPSSAPSYDRGASSRPMPSYGGGSYSRPAPSYDRGASSRPAPSYGGGSYNRPAPSYGGGGGGASSRSMPSYGGGGGAGRAPSYGSGGRPSGGGGGGHASAPSHSSGGGGGSAAHGGGGNPHGGH